MNKNCIYCDFLENHEQFYNNGTDYNICLKENNKKYTHKYHS